MLTAVAFKIESFRFRIRAVRVKTRAPGNDLRESEKFCFPVSRQLAAELHFKANPGFTYSNQGTKPLKHLV